MTVTSAEAALARARSALSMPTLYWLGHGGWQGEGPAPAQPGQPLDAAAALAELKTRDPAKYARYRAGLDHTGLAVEALPRLACDCSGFVAWCLGVPRFPARIAGEHRGWIYTDAIHADALGPRDLFHVAERATPGTLLVFKSPRDGEVGHVGIVSAVADGRPVGVIHCAPQNFLAEPLAGQPRNAIAETGTELFDAEARTIVVGWNAFGG